METGFYGSKRIGKNIHVVFAHGNNTTHIVHVESVVIYECYVVIFNEMYRNSVGCHIKASFLAIFSRSLRFYL